MDRSDWKKNCQRYLRPLHALSFEAQLRECGARQKLLPKQHPQLRGSPQFCGQGRRFALLACWPKPVPSPAQLPLRQDCGTLFDGQRELHFAVRHAVRIHQRRTGMSIASVSTYATYLRISAVEFAYNISHSQLTPFSVFPILSGYTILCPQNIHLCELKYSSSMHLRCLLWRRPAH